MGRGPRGSPALPPAPLTCRCPRPLHRAGHKGAAGPGRAGGTATAVTGAAEDENKNRAVRETTTPMSGRERRSPPPGAALRGARPGLGETRGAEGRDGGSRPPGPARPGPALPFPQRGAQPPAPCRPARSGRFPAVTWLPPPPEGFGPRFAFALAPPWGRSSWRESEGTLRGLNGG